MPSSTFTNNANISIKVIPSNSCFDIEREANKMTKNECLIVTTKTFNKLQIMLASMAFI